MRRYNSYNHDVIADLRRTGLTWREVAMEIGLNGSNADAKRVRQAHQHHLNTGRAGQAADSLHDGHVVQRWQRTEEGTVHIRYPEVEQTEEDVQDFWGEAMERFMRWQPRKDPPPLRIPEAGSSAVVSIYDAHFGMKADGAEIGTGESQDLYTISREFRNVADGLVSLARMYDPAEFVIPLGHDFGHGNQWAGKALTTRAGTEQDVDTRLWKIHLAICEASSYLIDAARSTGVPVRVYMVPGNHDPDENFKLGQYLTAWYRDDDGVTIDNRPLRNKYAMLGDANVVMMTHGEHYMKTKAQSPILTFAAECPREMWVQGIHRFVLSGHLHARRAGQYTPTSEVSEGMRIRTYVLPGLTATDSWHDSMGYGHARAATLQMFRREGGLLAQHEVHP